MFQFISYIKFLYHSKNQYGVHSPFVYQFLIKGLYPKLDKNLFNSFLQLRNQHFGKNYIRIKKAKILLKIINYFQPKTLLKISSNEGVVSDLMKLASKEVKISSVVDFLQIDQSNIFHIIFINDLTKIKPFSQLNELIHNDSFLILDNIHQNKKIEITWKEIIQNHEVTVSIDLFYFGLIFFRKEQEKQHFVLRS